MAKMESWKAKSKNQDLAHADERNWFKEKLSELLLNFLPKSLTLYIWESKSIA